MPNRFLLQPKFKVMDRVWISRITQKADGQLINRRLHHDRDQSATGYVIDAQPSGPGGLNQALLVLPVQFLKVPAATRLREAAGAEGLGGTEAATFVKAILGVPVVVEPDCSRTDDTRSTYLCQAFWCTHAHPDVATPDAIAYINDCVQRYADGRWPTNIPPIPAEWRHWAVNLKRPCSDGAGD